MTQGNSSSTSSVPTVVILGTDLLLTARPATPVQLAHACLAAGYTAALPVSWGDELLASALALRAAARPEEPVIACGCPYVADRFAGGDLERFLLPVASPPVATARYVREIYAGSVHITYVGACPGAHDAAIDALHTPGEFLARLRELGIDVEEQPVVFESVIPPDRRRYESLPGGVPTSDALRRAGAPHRLLELEGPDYVITLAQHLLEREALLIDVAPRLGCACAGASGAGAMRTVVAALEPPRARTPVVEASVRVDLDAPPRPMRAPATRLPEPAVARAPVVTPVKPAAPAETREEPVVATEPVREPALEPAMLGDAVPDEQLRHRSPALGVPRVGVATPVSRTPEGRRVPRAYLHRRRTPEDGAVRSEAPVETDRQAPIARHIEPPPAEELAPTRESEQVATPAPTDAEGPISRATTSTLTATDLVPPPPIMPEPPLGDELIVASSLAELIGMEAASSARTVASEPVVTEPAPTSAPRAPATTPPAPALPPPAPAPVPVASHDARTPAVEPPRESTPAAARPDLPPALPPTPHAAPIEMPRATPTTTPPEMARVVTPREMRRVTPVSAAPARYGSRERRAVVLPRRRRGSAALLWILFATVVAAIVLSIRVLVTGAYAVGAPRRPTAAQATLRDTSRALPARLPMLPPLLIDSAEIVAESTTTPDVAAPPVDSTPAVPRAARRAPRARSDSSARPDSSTVSDSSAQPSRVIPRRRRSPTLRPPATKTVTPTPTGARPDTLYPPLPFSARPVGSSAAPVDSLDSEFSSPRVTRPWPPPSEEP